MIRPLHDWILLELDPVVDRQGSIILPHGAAERTGRVLRTGPGRTDKNGILQPVGVSAGEVVVFRREHLEHRPGQAVCQVLEDFGDNLGMIRAPDILYAMERT